jgi:hypothetical protein
MTKPNRRAEHHRSYAQINLFPFKFYRPPHILPKSQKNEKEKHVALKHWGGPRRWCWLTWRRSGRVAWTSTAGTQVAWASTAGMQVAWTSTVGAWWRRTWRRSEAQCEPRRRAHGWHGPWRWARGGGVRHRCGGDRRGVKADAEEEWAPVGVWWWNGRVCV